MDWGQIGDEEVPVVLDYVDQAVVALEGPDIEVSSLANERLVAFSNRMNCYTYAEEALDTEHRKTTRFIILTALEKYISENWRAIDSVEMNHYKEFLIEKIEKFIQVPTNLEILRKLDLVLIQIAKRQWPDEWPDFLDYILGQNETLAHLENGIYLLFLLLQEISDYNRVLAPAWQAETQAALRANFSTIASYVESALVEDAPNSLISSVIDCVRYFFRIKESSELVQTPLFVALCENFIQNPLFVHKIMLMLENVSPHSAAANGLNETIAQIFELLITSLDSIFTNNQTATDEVQNIIATLSSLIAQFSELLEDVSMQDKYAQCLEWIFSAMESGCPDEIYFSILDMWLQIVRRVYVVVMRESPLPIYSDVLVRLRPLLITRMVWPADFVYVGEEGDVHRIKSPRTEETAAYYVQKELMVYLTNLDKPGMVETIMECFAGVQEDPSVFDSICFAAGAIEGAFTEAEEEVFISEVLPFLLQLLEQCPPSESNAVAAGMMHVCSQYTRFLNNSPEMLMSVMTKLVEFAASQNEKMVDVAVTSIRSISQSCHKNLSKTLPGFEQPFIQMVAEGFDLSSLSPDNALEMYEAIAMMVQDIQSEDEIVPYLQALAGPLVSVVESSEGRIADDEEFASLIFSLRALERISVYFGSTFFQLLEALVPQLIPMYALYSRAGNESISGAYDESLVRRAKDFKSTALGIVEGTLRSSPMVDSLYRTVVAPFIESIVPDFAESAFEMKPERVYNIAAVAVSKYREQLGEAGVGILELLLSGVEEYIPEAEPSFNIAMARFLSYEATLVSAPGAEQAFAGVLDVLKQLARGLQQEPCESALQTIHKMMTPFDQSVRQAVNAEYGADIVFFGLELLTDGFHRFAFVGIVELLRKMLVIESVRASVFEGADQLCALFPKKVPKELLEEFDAIAGAAGDGGEFRKLINDFLVSSNLVSPRDPVINHDEYEKLKKELIQKNQKVPGLGDSSPAISKEQEKKMNELAAFIASYSLRK